MLTASSGGEEASRNHTAVIEDQEVAGTQDFGEITEKIVAVLARSAIKDQHAAGATNRRWGLGNQRFG